MIKVKNLNFSYQNTKDKAIKNLNFEIDKGEVFGFLGPSGAGKTTAQRLIIGLLRGYTGDIEILGRERKDWNKSFYEKIGVAFDFPNLYVKLSAYENLNLIGSYYENPPKNIDELLDHVGLLKDKDKKVEGFSKGMKMRLNFIRSIMHDPDIVFFDEPTSGLDPVNAKIIKDKILDMKREGKTIFLTTHNMTVAEQLCDRVAFINEGSLSAIDSPKNLMVEHGKPTVDIEYLDKGKIVTQKIMLKNMNTNNNFKKILENHEIITIHSQEATLEDVFIL
ncbi:MAG: ABC transporter ATP-binding protein, partial [Acidaminobacteraceae bacterium]